MFHHDLFGLNLLPSGQDNPEHSIFVRSLNSLLIDCSRDTECPAKRSIRSFNLDVSFVSGFFDKFSLSLNDQGVLFHSNINLFLIHFRKVNFQNHLVSPLRNIRGRGPNSLR